MRFYLLFIAVLVACCSPAKLVAQVDQGQLGSWYMYFWNTTIEEGPWGLQGDVQHRSWNTFGDLEQRLLRGGVTYKPENLNVKFTLGYANILTGTFGPDDSSTVEDRIYQEALIPQKIGSRFYFTHRLRYEQRFVENQDFRTRYRYNLFLNIPLNNTVIEENTIYLALYNELFINGQKNIGNGRTVDFFDRNRSYAGFGYAFNKRLKLQLGWMRQITDTWSKNQLQFSVHHTF